MPEERSDLQIGQNQLFSLLTAFREENAKQNEEIRKEQRVLSEKMSGQSEKMAVISSTLESVKGQEFKIVSLVTAVSELRQECKDLREEVASLKSKNTAIEEAAKENRRSWGASGVKVRDQAILWLSGAVGWYVILRLVDFFGLEVPKLPK